MLGALTGGGERPHPHLAQRNLLARADVRLRIPIWARGPQGAGPS